MPLTGAPTLAYRTLMIFIDGGYLREGFKNLVGHDRIKFERLFSWLIEGVKWHLQGNVVPEIIRAYYYDAIVEAGEPEYKEQDEYFDEIRLTHGFDVRLGRLIRTESNDFRQKGVDVLLAIDMLNKAYSNHFDIALLLAGDDDYVDLVKVVKDGSGKRVYGVYFPENASKRLVKSFDERIELTKDIIDANHLAKPES